MGGILIVKWHKLVQQILEQRKIQASEGNKSLVIPGTIQMLKKRLTGVH
jgi:hypothetical protein